MFLVHLPSSRNAAGRGIERKRSRALEGDELSRGVTTWILWIHFCWPVPGTMTAAPSPQVDGLREHNVITGWVPVLAPVRARQPASPVPSQSVSCTWSTWSAVSSRTSSRAGELIKAHPAAQLIGIGFRLRATGSVRVVTS